ncbi:MAG: GNAT family N-acetyltransferase [Oscillospiraceae bacterium]|nr:GNAT family N-acetyltransferase [Oscillospiraceae bacterium]
MIIRYKDTKHFTKSQVQELFQSVNWISANYPDRLLTAFKNCETVYSAWDNEKLVGIVNAVDDGALTAFVPYLCVNPSYQGKGIGKELLNMIKEKYKDYLYIELIAENEGLIKYYKSNGFNCLDTSFVCCIKKNDLK